MDIKIFLLLGHLIGFALGLGGATISDLTFFRTLKDKKISPTNYSFLRMLSKIIWIGLAILIVTGIGFIVLSLTRTGTAPMLASPRFQAKLTLVAVVLINGLVFAKRVFPFFVRATETGMLFAKRRLLAITGSVSIVSWYSILLLSILPRGLPYPYLFYIGIYLALLLVAILGSSWFLKRKLA